MEKSQYKLCSEVLRRFHKAGILDHLILIGSWCVYFYQDYFSDVPFIDQATLRTRDIDFLVDNPSSIRKEVDVPELLRDLGFVRTVSGSAGYIKLEHPDLLLEFLSPERGKGANRPVSLKKLGMNAVPLRFLNFLSKNTIRVRFEGYHITLPHPANFALHKLIIFQRRLKVDKAAKDRNVAIGVLRSMVEKGESSLIKEVFRSIPVKWQQKVLRGLKEADLAQRNPKAIRKIRKGLSEVARGQVEKVKDIESYLNNL